MSEPITNVEDAVAALGALPMPVGSEPRTLDRVEDELTGANLALYEEELLTARLRLALASAQRGRRELRAGITETKGALAAAVKAAEGSVAELRREHEENARLRARIAELEQAAACQSVASVNGARCCLPVRHRGDHRTEDKRQYWDDEFAVPAPARAERSAERLRSLLADQRTSLEDPHDGPLAHTYRLGRDLPEMGSV